jgi:hypothetical protein
MSSRPLGKFPCRPCACGTSRQVLDGEALDAHTTAWVETVNRSGAAYLTPAVLDGRWMARVSIGALVTEEADVATVWAAMREAAEAQAERLTAVASR